jgi:hypothetical protein
MTSKLNHQQKFNTYIQPTTTLIITSFVGTVFGVVTRQLLIGLTLQSNCLQNNKSTQGIVRRSLVRCLSSSESIIFYIFHTWLWAVFIDPFAWIISFLLEERFTVRHHYIVPVWASLHQLPSFLCVCPVSRLWQGYLLLRPYRGGILKPL